MIEIANTVRKPVFIPKIRNIEETTSPGFATDMFVRSIFSGDWKRGTLRIALIKNKTNKVTETVLTWFCSLGNLSRIALPRMIPWDNPIPNVHKITISWIRGSLKLSTSIGIKAIHSKINIHQNMGFSTIL